MVEALTTNEEIQTPLGTIKVRQIPSGYWVWSTPNGFGGLESTKLEAQRSALRAQDLRPEDYGIRSY